MAYLIVGLGSIVDDDFLRRILFSRGQVHLFSRGFHS